ncbi:1-acyl-sn-glycerol-3-phosphate acyltransferase [Longibacter salinarum]|nr:1-acyl-sn-glycerol-3-phosphate acyltransferase [Longibacter salinarum]
MDETPPKATEGLPDTSPVILYANHHHFYDGHLLWYLLRHALGRPGTIWMEEWDRYPFFAAVGAQPFPTDDSRRRAATIRRTARRFREAPRTVMVYFPEGELHTPAEGIHPFPEGAAQRLARFYPEATWWPIAIDVTFWGDKHPTACLLPGTPHSAPDGNERDRLTRLWHTLRETLPEAPHHVLLNGRPSPTDVWDFSRFASLFARYLKPL